MSPGRGRLCGVVGISIAALVILSIVGCSGGSSSRLDSVVLITLDTLRADHLSCYGDSPVRTPNLDRMADRGLRVRQAWSTVPLTTPAHASILTGLYPPGHGVRNNARFRLTDDVTTLAEVLGSSERSTAAFVGSFTTSRIFGLAQGFERFDDDMGRNANGRMRSSRRGDQVVARAVEWLERNGERPFFLWVHLYDPHTPYDAPPPFRGTHAGHPYGDEVAFTDAVVGELLKALDTVGAISRTVVVATADHGESLGDHGEPEHGYLLYEPAVRVPLLVVAPGAIEPGTVIHGPASLVDIMPTVLGLVGEPVPEGLQGVDLLLSTDDAVLRERRLYAETLYPHEEFDWSALYALRVGDLKYIASPLPELFDLAADPRESSDLSESRGDLGDSMAEELRAVSSGLVDVERLAGAAGTGGENLDAESLDRLRSLGYLGGGSVAAPGGEDALPAVGGRNPRDSMGLLAGFMQASALLAARRYDESAAILTRLVTDDPGNPQFRLKLARATDRAGRPDDAEALYRRLIEDHPTFYLGYNTFSGFLEREGRPEESRDLWLQLAERVPGYVGVTARVARAEVAAGLHDDARNRLAGHLEGRPDDAAAWAQMGRAREGCGDLDGALEAYRRALDLKPTLEVAVRGSVDLLVAADRAGDAAELVDDLLTRAPHDPYLMRVRTGL